MDESTLLQFLLELHIEDFTLYGQTDHRIGRLSSSSKFWETKAKRDFDVDPKEFYQTRYQPKMRYIELLSQKTVTYGSENFRDVEDCLLFAARENDELMANYFILQGAKNLDNALMESCKSKANKVITLLERRGASNWNWALRGAAKSGDRELVARYLEKGANDFDGALVASILSKQDEIISLFLDLGAKDLDRALEAAASIGDLNLVSKLLTRGARAIGNAYEAARENSHQEVIILLKGYERNISRPDHRKNLSTSGEQ